MIWEFFTASKVPVASEEELSRRYPSFNSLAIGVVEVDIQMPSTCIPL
jgi:hypothetical protein